MRLKVEQWLVSTEREGVVDSRRGGGGGVGVIV
jgi:hypothetical protein